MALTLCCDSSEVGAVKIEVTLLYFFGSNFCISYVQTNGFSIEERKREYFRQFHVISTIDNNLALTRCCDSSKVGAMAAIFWFKFEFESNTTRSTTIPYQHNNNNWPSLSIK